MDAFLDLLMSNAGRDGIIRATSYISLYWSSRTRGNFSLKLRKISEELSYCRIILRLFDDLPMLRQTIMYGIGRQEEGFVLRFLGVLENLIDQLYYPVEHIAWAADKGLIKANSSLFSLAGVVLWASSCYISVIRLLMTMSQLQKKTIGLKNVSIHETIVKKQLELLLHAIANVSNFVIAVNYFPAGSFLWAGKLDTRTIGLCGIISSLVRILMMARHMKKT